MSTVRGAVAPWSIRDRDGLARHQPVATSVGQLPSAIADYFWHLDGWRPDDAAACHTIDTLNARPAPGDSEGMARLVYEGRDQLGAAFRERGTRPVHHHVIGWAAEGGDVFIEGIVFDDDEEPVMGFLSSVRVGPGGIERYVAFRSDPPEPRHRVCLRRDTPAGALESFLAELVGGTAGAIGTLLADDVVVEITDPSVCPGVRAKRLRSRGREDALGVFQRFDPAAGHSVVATAADGGEQYLEAVVHGRHGPDRTVLLAATVGRDSRLTRVVGHSCAPAIARHSATKRIEVEHESP